MYKSEKGDILSKEKCEEEAVGSNIIMGSDHMFIDVVEGQNDGSVSQEECKKYAEEHGNPHEMQYYGSTSPSGCFHFTWNNIVYFNHFTTDIPCQATHACIQKAPVHDIVQYHGALPAKNILSERDCRTYAESKGLTLRDVTTVDYRPKDVGIIIGMMVL